MPVNVVEVHAGDLDREADFLLRAAPGAGPQPESASKSGEQQSSTNPSDAGWSDIMPGLITLLSFAVFPQWAFSAEEQAELSKASAEVLEQVFPGGMGNKRWAPWIRLGLVSSGVVLARFHPDDGFPPLGPRREKPVGPEPSSTAAGAGSTHIP